MTLDEIAKRIDEHLERFERDPQINKLKEGRTLHPYYHSSAVRCGRYVGVSYVSFQGRSNLTKSDAEEYLRWLDAGNVGKHTKALSFNTRVHGTDDPTNRT
jgi:hypothetical protein